ncbi:chemotaxis protein CheW [Noviherbaspirillum denitrificans]|uniref:Chemotaxis protein CheW n=1 Tax=Noviherbaspirillum denitrificans TaxID=1968433 RepID=A0A254TDK7_9BURK|nr:chemotaxis protein CheW [Noviherbaspirillum denitrificans]OWW20729.1 hypothetical protein AYR66_15795 [Noviherbaspirillum denitrificans]
MSAQAIEDCWNRVGVRGNRSCEKLAEHTHCRHCSVYGAAAQAIMQRQLPAGYREEWAEYFSREEADETERDRAVLVFRIGSEWLALPAALAVTVVEAARPHRIPRRSGGVLGGIVNVKGRLFPCMSLAALLSINDSQPQQDMRRRAYPRLVVFSLAHQAFALAVDDMSGIHRYAASDLLAVPTTAGKGLRRYLSGVLALNGMHVGVLDPGVVGAAFSDALK